MDARVHRVRKEWIKPADVSEVTFLLAPVDLVASSSGAFLTWPFFFKYDIDGDKLIEVLKKISIWYPHLCGRVHSSEETRFVVKVDPGNEDGYGFIFEELKLDLSIAKVVLEHTPLKAKSAEFPVLPEQPFYIDAPDIGSMLKGEAPLAKMTLTHLSDGCVLNVSVAHLLVDGKGCIDFILDLGSAYRGEVPPDRDHDRSRTWPDQLAKRYPFLGSEVAKMPRKATQNMEQPGIYEGFPGQSCSAESLYLTNDMLDKMVEMANKFLVEKEQVSVSDVLVAFYWMLMCDATAKKRPIKSPADLDIIGTTAACTSYLIQSPADIVPNDYWGNEYVVNLIPSNGIKAETLPELFAKLAAKARQTVMQLKNPHYAAQSMLMYYNVVSSGSFPAEMGKTRIPASVIDVSKTAIDKIDFGNGAPAFAYVIPPIPFLGGVSVVGPAPCNDGVFLTMPLSENQKAALKDSAILQEFAPAARMLADFTITEFDALMRHQKQA